MRKTLPRLVLLAALVSCSAISRAQGCTQCRDNAAAIPDETQKAYRHAIVLLVVSAGALFAGTVLLLKRWN